MSNRVILFLTVAAVLAAGARAQERRAYSPDAEKHFSAGLSLFEKRDYVQAFAMFSSIIDQPIMTQRTTAAYLMGAKSLLGQHRYDAARDLIGRFLARYPESEYAEEAEYTHALSTLLMGRYREAGTELIGALESTKNQKVLVETRTLLEVLFEDRIDIRLAEDLLNEAAGQPARNLLSIFLAEKLLKEGNVARSEYFLNQVKEEDTTSATARRARLLRERIPMKRAISVGVMLPLMQTKGTGPVKALATDILNGINVALREHRRISPNGEAVTIEVRDTERDSATATKVLRELADDRDVVAVLGPVFSNIASLCAPLANSLLIPLLSPTATGDGLAGSGRFVFQLSPDATTRGRAMAQYAVGQLGYHTLAILSPDDSASIAASRGFEREAELLGARVAAMEIYNRDSSDLRDQFMNIRRAGTSVEPQVSFARAVPRAVVRAMVRAGADPWLVDSVRRKQGSIGVTHLFGPRGRHIADSLHLKVIVPRMNEEDLDIPTLGIQGMFLPITDADEIGVVSSQIKYFNIQTQILGSSEWDDLGQLDAHRRDAGGAIFLSDSYVDRTDSSYRNFSQLYTALMGAQPNRFSLIGFDAMNLLLSVIDGKAVTRAALAHELGRVGAYRGVHSVVDLTRGRVNTFLHILRYQKGDIEKVGEIFVH